MLLATYLVALGVWIAWIYAHYYYGDRPTSYVWFAVMTALGVFEYSKSLYAMINEHTAVAMAIGVAFFTLGGILFQHARVVWRGEPAAEGRVTPAHGN
jgi:uncharacterized integral membrane protein